MLEDEQSEFASKTLSIIPDTFFFFFFQSKWEKVIQIRKGCSGLKPYGDHRPCTTRCTDQLSAGFQENNAVRTDFWNCPETPHQHSVIRAWKMWKRGLGGKMKWKYGVIAPAVWKGRQWKGFKSLLRRFERTSQFTSFKTDGQSKKKKKRIDGRITVSLAVTFLKLIWHERATFLLPSNWIHIKPFWSVCSLVRPVSSAIKIVPTPSPGSTFLFFLF